MNQLQRDLGRVEAKVEIMTDDLQSIKKDLGEIKGNLVSVKAVKDSDLKRLALVGTLAAIATQAINWFKPFFS